MSYESEIRRDPSEGKLRTKPVIFYDYVCSKENITKLTCRTEIIFSLKSESGLRKLINESLIPTGRFKASGLNVKQYFGRICSFKMALVTLFGVRGGQDNLLHH